ncbi:MAG: hypothetical protein HYY07_05420, partial [Elusimicrobia bacterium]|nr:hypothetical protein [Elusimicrobiota bacterium]
VRSDLHGEIEQLRSDLTKEIKKEADQVRSDLHEEIEQLRSDLNQKIDKLTVAILNLTERVERLEENNFTKQDGQRLMEWLDNFARRIETYDGKAIVHDRRLEDHEERITRLEVKTESSAPH